MESIQLERSKVIRQPIVTVAGHVDHGKTSILDCFRQSEVQEGESGGITQRISFTKFPLAHVIGACPLIKKSGVKLDIPGFLFIDTPGHAAFTNLRKRGGSLADLAVVVVSVKEGIKPQTAEVLQILKANKTPFLIALNKIDTISGWQRDFNKNLRESVEGQAVNVKQEFVEKLGTFQGALQEHGFDSDLYWEVDDFKKKAAIVPCSAKTKEGIAELLFVLCGLCQKFLRSQLELGEQGRGVVLEVKKDKGMKSVEAILYDGSLEEGDDVVIASLEGEPIETKVKGIEEIMPLCESDFCNVKKAQAATGVRLHLKESEGILSGMPFQKFDGNLDEVKKEFKREVSGALQLDKEGIIVKADSLGSLEALITLLREGGVKVVKAGIGLIGKSDVTSAKANLEINELDSVILGFNVGLEEGVESDGIKILSGDVVYKLIEDLKDWRQRKQGEIEKERLMGLGSVCKLEILGKYVFRNSSPAIFGVRVLGGKVKTGMNLIDELGEEVGRIKSLQLEKESVDSAGEGEELAVSIPGVNFERRLGDKKFLYADIGLKQFKEFKKNKDLLSEGEKGVLAELVRVKGFD